MTGLRLRGIRRARPDSGVALIEAALILPFLALLVFGMIEAGFAFRDGNILARATQQAARTDSRLAENLSADYEALRALDSGLSSLTASSVQRVVIYDATTVGDEPPAACRTVARPDDTSAVGINSGATRCNVYSATQVRLDAPGSFGCGGGDWDAAFCPSSRDQDTPNPDRIGVWVELTYDKVTTVLPGNLTLQRASVYQLEPCIAGVSTC
ncbi:MAG: pilus assembly protein [Acidimicrobiales bacterium]|nr:pilus assembly protein [Acidimicrobiales bacterium]